MGFSDHSAIKFSCNAGDAWDVVSIPGSGRSSGGDLQPTLVFLPGKSHGQRNLVGHSLWGCKDSDTTEWLTLSLPFTIAMSMIRNETQAPKAK